MKYCILVLLLFTTTNITLAQNKSCPCPPSSSPAQKAVQTFKLNKTKTVGVCGQTNKRGKATVFSEFVLFECGTTDTIFDWDGTQTCSVKQVKDTLVVQEYFGIPNGPNLSVIWLEFFVTKFYYNNGRIESKESFRTDLKKYTPTEIKKVITQFEAIKEPISNYDKYLLAVRRLFWAAVSGSDEAKAHLEQLTAKYGTFDGAIAEEFDDIIMTYMMYR